MANNLTGEYEAVVQVAVPQINGLLAALHQNGANDDAKLKLLHSVTMRIGDRPVRPVHDVDFANWIRDFQSGHGTVGLDDLRRHLTDFAPPGAAKAIDKAFATLLEVGSAPSDPVRGTARLQIGSPRLSLPNGSTSEVTLHLQVRAHYTPDPGTEPIPQPIHGEVRATFEIREVRSARGFPHRHGRKLSIQPSSDEGKIAFISAPGAGLSATDVSKIAVQIRKTIREDFMYLPVGLPDDFAFSDFKAVSGGSNQAVALPMQLSGAWPSGGIHSITQFFVGSAGFAFAVSKEFVAGIFQPTINSLRQFTTSFQVPIPVLADPTYNFSVTDVALQFNDGSIDLRIQGKATTSSLWPDYNNIVITQRFTLVLFLGTLFISAPDDAVTISGLPDSAKATVTNVVIAQRNATLPSVQGGLNTQLGSAVTRFTNALRSFDESATAALRAGSSEEPGSSTSGGVAITPDGIIFRGDISGGGRSAPVVAFAETDQHDAFSALASWVPGGRIERFTWSWVEYLHHSIWSGVEKSATEAHRFIFPKPAAVTSLSGICLSIEGTQILPDGRVVPVTAGTICHASDFGQLFEAPSWFEAVTVPIWTPNSTEDAVLNDLIAGHLSVQSDTLRGRDLTHNSLVHFVDWGSDEPLGGLVRAFSRMRRKSFSLVVIVVLPAGAFDSRRRDVERKLRLDGERIPVQVLVTQDDENGWTRTFGVSRRPSIYLVDAQRRFVWKHEGDIDPDLLAAALDQHLLPAPAPRFRPLRLGVSETHRAPDAFFEDDKGQTFALHRLRGQAVLLNFWQAWSAPCIKELIRLQRLHERDGAHAPVVVAFHGGSDRKTIDVIRKQHGLSFPLVQDVDQRIARMYGVRCWPTTISVSADGAIQHVQFGIARERA